MKMLLTSGGISNKSIINELRILVGKEFFECNLVFIPTAANAELGDKKWLINDLLKCKELGFKEIDIVDIAVVDRKMWFGRLKNADVIIVGGGNTSYLMEQIKKSGLYKDIPKLLDGCVYVGISAGSMVVSPKLYEKEMNKIYDEPIFSDNKDADNGLGLVDFLVVPHLDSFYFPKVSKLIGKIAKEIKITCYAIDDQTAVKVVDGKVDIVSEGKWKRFN